MLIPNVQEIEQTEYAEKTYRLDLNGGRIAGKIDGLDAVRQAIQKLFHTEKNAHNIYTSYGSELEQLIGKDFLYASSMAKKFITEALLSDSRILSVDDFTFETKADSLFVKFTVNTIYGSISEGVSI